MPDAYLVGQKLSPSSTASCTSTVLRVYYKGASPSVTGKPSSKTSMRASAAITQAAAPLSRKLYELDSTGQRPRAMQRTSSEDARGAKGSPTNHTHPGQSLGPYL